MITTRVRSLVLLDKRFGSSGKRCAPSAFEATQGVCWSDASHRHGSSICSEEASPRREVRGQRQATRVLPMLTIVHPR